MSVTHDTEGQRMGLYLLQLFKDRMRKELTDKALEHIRAEVMEAAKRIVDELEPTMRAHMRNDWEHQLIVQLAIKEPKNG